MKNGYGKKLGIGRVKIENRDLNLGKSRESLLGIRESKNTGKLTKRATSIELRFDVSDTWFEKDNL